MKVLVAHVRYRHRGGEDAVVEREIEMLRGAGVEVASLVIDSTDFESLPLAKRMSIAASQGDHAYGRAAMWGALSTHRPDVVHAHNLYPLLGPGALREAATAGCATVHTWHNYRASCLAGTHLYHGDVCVRCNVGRRTLGVLRGCYRGSHVQSLSLEAGIKSQLSALAHGVPEVALCITDFQRGMYLKQGLPASRLLLKPNSVAAGHPLPWAERSGVVFVGRLSPEKGVLGLIGAWQETGPILTVIGDGPQAGLVQEMADGLSNVVVRGALSSGDTRAAIRSARVLAFPSLWFEGLPLTVLEALSEGTPIVTFGGGAVESLVPELSVKRGDYRAFVRQANSLACASEGKWNEISAKCVALHGERYTDERNVASLIRLYERLASDRGRRA